MYANAINMYGIFYFLIMIAVPLLLFVFLIKWIYQIKKNSETQVQQNKEISQLLKREIMKY